LSAPVQNGTADIVLATDSGILVGVLQEQGANSSKNQRLFIGIFTKSMGAWYASRSLPS
jgi:hypothetical protein